MAEGDYSPKAILAIISHVAAEGTVFDAPYVYPAEADTLTEVFIRGSSPYPMTIPRGDTSRTSMPTSRRPPTNAMRPATPIGGR